MSLKNFNFFVEDDNIATHFEIGEENEEKAEERLLEVYNVHCRRLGFEPSENPTVTVYSY